MVNLFLLQEASAMPFRMKMVCLTQEVVRILRNTSTSEDEGVKNYFLSEFALRLQVSGYPAGFRQAVIEAGIKTYEHQLERYRQGESRTRSDKCHGGDQMMLFSFVPPALCQY